MATPAAVLAKQVQITYGEGSKRYTAVEDINFDVQPAENL